MTLDNKFIAHDSFRHGRAKFAPLFSIACRSRRECIMVADVCEQSVREIRRCCDESREMNHACVHFFDGTESRAAAYVSSATTNPPREFSIATFVGGKLPISQALQFLVAQPTANWSRTFA